MFEKSFNDNQEASELMRIVRDNKQSDIEKAKESFGIIYQKYNKLLMTLCQKTCGNIAIADLVYQETFRRMWRSPLYNYNKHHVSFRIWMSKIANNAWLDIRQKIVLGSDIPLDQNKIEAMDDIIEERNMTINEKLLKGALEQLTSREYDIMTTYIAYDTDKGMHVPDNILEELKTKYHTTPENLRVIKWKALKKVKDYINRNR